VLSNFAIAIIMAAAIYLNFRLPRVYRTNAAMLLGAILTLGLLSVFAAVSGWGLLQKLAGGG
jgi:hypothetical protein